MSINSTQIHSEKLLRHPPHISSQHEKLRDTIRPQRNHKTPFERPHIFKQPFWVSGDVCWCLLVSVCICCCTEITGVGFWEHNNGVYVCLWCCYDVWMRLKGVYECLGLVWWSKCSILEKLRMAKFLTLDTFKISKYQNHPIKAP